MLSQSILEDHPYTQTIEMEYAYNWETFKFNEYYLPRVRQCHHFIKNNQLIFRQTAAAFKLNAALLAALVVAELQLEDPVFDYSEKVTVVFLAGYLARILNTLDALNRGLASGQNFLTKAPSFLTSAEILYFCEAQNRFRYRYLGFTDPSLWMGTSLFSSGKIAQDSSGQDVFYPSQDYTGVGVASILRWIQQNPITNDFDFKSSISLVSGEGGTLIIDKMSYLIPINTATQLSVGTGDRFALSSWFFNVPDHRFEITLAESVLIDGVNYRQFFVPASDSRIDW